MDNIKAAPEPSQENKFRRYTKYHRTIGSRELEGIFGGRLLT